LFFISSGIVPFSINLIASKNAKNNCNSYTRMKFKILFLAFLLAIKLIENGTIPEEMKNKIHSLKKVNDKLNEVFAESKKPNVHND
jgi:hypothetical protein